MTGWRMTAGLMTAGLMTKRTYVDANLLIAAWHGRDEAGMQAIDILDDPARTLVVSDALWLEVMPKPLYFRRSNESDFYLDIFNQAERIPWQIAALEQARGLAERYGIAAMDAIHVAIAIAAGVDELVSAEKPEKPMFRVTEIPVRSLRRPPS
jgi:predicted nucleic acid-binding protein